MSATAALLLDPAETPADQYRAAESKCVIVDLSDRDQIELTGADRAAFLHNFCTQEIKKLAAGHGAEAFLTNIKGRILGHVLVFVGDDALWLDGPPGTAAAIVPHLDRYLITEDVQIADRSSDWGELALIGPQAAQIVDKLIPGGGQWQLFQHGHGEGITVRRFSFTRQPGWLVGTSRAQLPSLAARLLTASAVLCSRDVFHALCIEAGFPQYGIDLTDEHLAQEAGRTKQAISFTKGCYLGQEPIARIDALGHTNRELRSLQLDGSSVPNPGDKVLQPGTDTELGTVSSAARSPVTKRAVAFAMLRHEASGQGTGIEIAVNDQREQGTVGWN
ncbi:MAG: YgfZ/GcvT domain-containing protein [Planctomycetaceae bacterium]